MYFMQFLFILYMCALMIIEIKCQAMFTINSEHPDHPGMCYYNDSFSPEKSRRPFFLNPGQKRQHPKNCISIECTETLGLKVFGCGVFKTINNCRIIKGNTSKPYPSCCSKLVC